jgi:hypothetical protein
MWLAYIMVAAGTRPAHHREVYCGLWPTEALAHAAARRCLRMNEDAYAAGVYSPGEVASFYYWQTYYWLRRWIP